MENLEWHPFYYNGLETNIEATKCGRIKRIEVDWNKGNAVKIEEIDFTKIKLHPKGYRCIGVLVKDIGVKKILVHQIIASVFLNHQINGLKLVVDHINSDKTDNRINNLRIVTNRENVSKELAIKTGLPTGVSFIKNKNRFKSEIYINRKRIYLGCFKDSILASQAYQNALNNL
jgi:hypothetical protein